MKYVFLLLLSAFPLFISQTLPANAQSIAIDKKVTDEMIQPTDLFADFPEIKWEMGFAEAKSAIDKKSKYPAARQAESALVWEGPFDGVDGRGTIVFDENKCISQIGAIIYAMDKRTSIFEQLQKKISEKHGAPTSSEETSVDISNLWRMKSGYVIELRSIKDEESLVIDIHWVKLRQPEKL